MMNSSDRLTIFLTKARIPFSYVESPFWHEFSLPNEVHPVICVSIGKSKAVIEYCTTGDSKFKRYLDVGTEAYWEVAEKIREAYYEE